MNNDSNNYSGLFYLNPLSSWIYELSNFKILDVNTAATLHYGFSKEEFLKLTLVDLDPQSNRMELLTRHENINKEQGLISFGTETHQTKQGLLLQVETNGYFINYDNQECILVTCQEVTDDQNRNELSTGTRAESHYISTISISKIGYWHMDFNTSVFTWSDAKYAIWGRTRENFEVSYENFAKTVHPSDLPAFEKELASVYEGAGNLDYTSRIILPDGSIRWVHELGRIIKDDAGKLVAFEGTTQDVTQQKQEELRLRLLESVITHTSDAIVISSIESGNDPSPRIIYVNNAFTKMTGYESHEIIGKSPKLFQGPESNREELQKLSLAIKNWEPCKITVINYKKDGSEFWVNYSVVPVADEKGWFTHWVAIERDVTEQKLIELEKELLGQISQAFNSENEYKSAAQKLCTLLGEFGKFDWVELWTTNLDKTQMHVFSHYLKSDSDYAHSNYSTNGNNYHIPEGLAGKVYVERKKVICSDKESLNKLVQNKELHIIGLNAIIGIPLLFDNEIVGILKIGTKFNEDYLKKYTRIFDRLEQYVGAELNRKKVENDLTHLFDAIPDILCLLSLEGEFLKINKAGCDLLGYQEEEIIGQHFTQFMRNDDRIKISGKLQELKAGQTTFEFENRFITKSGGIIWLSWFGNASFSEELIYATGKNSTTEKNLKELNRQAARLARIGNGEINLVENTIFWSDEMHQLYETNPKTFVPTFENTSQFYRSDFDELIQCSINECIANGTAIDIEVVLITATKKELWIRMLGIGEFLDGKCHRIYGSIQDINERKEAEIRLQSFSNDLPGVVFQYYIYPDGTDSLKFVTKGAQKLWGFSPEEVMHDNQCIWQGARATGDEDKIRKSVIDSIAFRKQWTVRYNYRMPSGEIATHLGFGTPNFIADGTIIFNSLILDVTNETKSEQLLEQVSKVAKIGSWEYDFTTQRFFWSDIVHQIAETTPETYIPELTSAIQFFDHDFRGILESKLYECMKYGTSVDFEAKITTNNKNNRWIRVLGNAERQGERTTKVYGSIQDIHLAKSLEIQISEILGSISDAFYALDKDWKFTYFNKEAEILLKETEKDTIGKIIWDLFPSIIGTKMDEVFRFVTQNKAPSTFEYLFTDDGIWYEVSVYPSSDGIAVYFKNIQERKSNAENLVKAFNEKNRILESIGDSFFAVDNDWIVTYWNNRAEVVFKRKREDIVGKNLLLEYPDYTDALFHEMYHKAMDTRTAVTFEDYLAVSNMWFEVSVYPSEDGLSIYFKDNTLKILGNLELVLANERFEKVTEATEDVIWDWDLVNKTHFRSKAIERFFGKGSSKTYANNDFWVANFHKEDIVMLQNSLTNAVNDTTSDRWELEYRILNAEGQIIYIIDRGVITREENGKAVRMVGAMTDISEQKHLQFQLNELNKSLQQYATELERSNKELEQFAFVASHDLQEPLRMISSFMDQLKRKYGNQLDEKAHQYIYFATDGAKRMKQIILDLLDYSRASKPTEGIETVNLNDVLAEYTQLRRKLISEKLAIVTSVQLPTLVTYKAVVTQVIHCLLDNALKYSRKDVPPKIEIMINEDEIEWTFSIKDNGIGIDSQFFDKIFIIFQRLHNKEEHEGTGIGLSIAKRHLEFLGGRIWVDSIIDRGTLFFFTIPKT